ncbi:hypothetical protein [Microbacterium sp. YJN-G]|uniref:hypothetical protein n=1 Tax=Microbacterium sp. YJN-G TaxID=2763257 RepID=UPI0018786472|nr:hypothetical protein [Microbacterium sp. YJN-G]
MSSFAVKAVIIVIVIALIGVLIARAFRRVRPGAAGTTRQRMPLLFALAGAVLLAIGFVLALASFTSRYTADLLPARIAAVVAFAAGVVVLLAYRNWYVETGMDAVRFRTITGREKQIAYRDIVSRETVRFLGRPRVVVRSRDGVTLRVDARRYDLARVVTASRG